MEELDTLWFDTVHPKPMTRQRVRSAPSDNEKLNGIPDYLVKPQAAIDDHAHTCMGLTNSAWSSLIRILDSPISV